MYTIKVGEKTFDIVVKGNTVEVNGKVLSFDLISLEAKRYHLLLNNKSYTLEIVNYDIKEKQAIIKVNNREIPVSIKTDMDLLLTKMGLNNHQNNVARDVGAPMPGLILDVVVTEGDEETAKLRALAEQRRSSSHSDSQSVESTDQ